MRDSTTEKRGLSVDETCYVGGFGRSRFYEAVAAGQLVVRKFGRRTITLREDLDRFLAALPVVNAEIKPPGALAGRSENLNRTAPQVIKQRPAVVDKVPPGKVRGRALRPGRSVRSAD